VLSGASTQKLANARARGVSLTVRSDEACLLEVEARLSATVARRLKIPARVASTSAIARVGTRSLRLVLTEKASRRLRRQRRVSLTLSATCRDVPGNRSATARRKVSLRRGLAVATEQERTLSRSVVDARPAWSTVARALRGASRNRSPRAIGPTPS